MSAQIIPFPVRGAGPLWDEYQRHMRSFLNNQTETLYLRALMSYGLFCINFDERSADRNIAAFVEIHGEKFRDKHLAQMTHYICLGATEFGGAA